MFTSYWLLYRKNYLTGIVTMIINIVATALNLVCSAQLAGFDLPALSQPDLYQKMFTDESFRYLMLSMTLVTLIDAALRVFLGLFGNWTYQNSICGKIHRLRQTEPDDYTEYLPSIGGVSFVVGALAYILATYLPRLLFTFLS